jgi:hypothetical protein
VKRVALLVALIVASLSGCGGPAQIGADEHSFKAVDALYTAVSLRDLRLVEQCEKSLQELQAATKLPAAAGEFLKTIITEARAGKWEAAQLRLGDFMRGQRR